MRDPLQVQPHVGFIRRKYVRQGVLLKNCERCTHKTDTPAKQAVCTMDGSINLKAVFYHIYFLRGLMSENGHLFSLGMNMMLSHCPMAPTLDQITVVPTHSEYGEEDEVLFAFKYEDIEYM